MALVHFGLSPFVASMIGAGTAVTFVYIVSQLAIFHQGRTGGVTDYAIYVVWQVVAITIASLLVAFLARILEPSFIALTLSMATGIAKVLVTPLTLGANFLFMKWLTGRHEPAPKPTSLQAKQP